MISAIRKNSNCTDCSGSSWWRVVVEQVLVATLFLLLFGADPLLHGFQLLGHRRPQRRIQFQELREVGSRLRLVPHGSVGFSALVKGLYVVC